MLQPPPKKHRKLMSRPEPFRHSALDTSKPHIRLIRLLSRKRNGTLRLEVRNNVPLGPDGFDYCALSYEWGPPQPVRRILIDEKPFEIRENLYLFLKNLYGHHKGRELGLLWADAICVDQKNVQERNHQVQQMKQVYQGALKVFAWIGPSEDVHTRKAFQLLQQCYLEQQARDANADDQAQGERGESEDFIWRRLWQDGEVVTCLLAIYQRSYWRRLWIVQELALGQEVQIICDNQTVNWNAIMCSVLQLPLIKRLENDGLSCLAITTFISEAMFPGLQMTLLRAIEYLRNSQCEKSHDKVYGLLGLVDDSHTTPIDYNMSIEDLFLHIIEFARENTSIGAFFALSDALNVSFFWGVHPAKLHFTSKATSSSPKRCKLNFQWSDRRATRSSLVESGTPVEKLGKSMTAEKQFRWKLVYFHTPLNDLGTSMVNRDMLVCNYFRKVGNNCDCQLCKESRVALRYSPESIPEKIYASCQVFHASSELEAGSGFSRQFPQVLFIFHQRDYLATILVYGWDNFTDSGDTDWHRTIIFHDPFYDRWLIEDDIEPSCSDLSWETRRPISIPLMSIFVILMHASALAPP
ncbi:hypothetical protein MMC30_007062 [Trapelia coarctata]|nr:hypothetical protein [Trapelia coarctata]